MAFAIYKPGQGKYVRITTGALFTLLTGYGAHSLEATLADTGTFFTLFGQDFTYAQVIPIAVFLVIVAALVWGLNYAKFADFLIETEVEMGRVIWPTRRSVIGSSIVVVLTVVVMSALLFGVDKLLFTVMHAVGLY